MYQIRSKSTRGSCWTVPYTDSSRNSINPVVNQANGTQLANTGCVSSKDSQKWSIKSASYTEPPPATTAPPATAPTAAASSPPPFPRSGSLHLELIPQPASRARWHWSGEPTGVIVSAVKATGRFSLDLLDSVLTGAPRDGGNEVPLFKASLQVESAPSAAGPWTSEIDISASDGYRLADYTGGTWLHPRSSAPTPAITGGPAHLRVRWAWNYTSSGHRPPLPDWPTAARTTPGP